MLLKEGNKKKTILKIIKGLFFDEWERFEFKTSLLITERRDKGRKDGHCLFLGPMSVENGILTLQNTQMVVIVFSSVF